MFARKLLAAAALSVAAAGPVSAQSAAPLSLANSPVMRAGAPLDDASDLRGLTPVLLGAVVVAILVFVLVDLGKDNALPDSP